MAELHRPHAYGAAFWCADATIELGEPLALSSHGVTAGRGLVVAVRRFYDRHPVGIDDESLQKLTVLVPEPRRITDEWTELDASQLRAVFSTGSCAWERHRSHGLVSGGAIRLRRTGSALECEGELTFVLGGSDERAVGVPLDLRAERKEISDLVRWEGGEGHGRQSSYPPREWKDASLEGPGVPYEEWTGVLERPR